MIDASLEVWVTGGGSREAIDAVRYIGNYSTGRLAHALVLEILRRGHRARAFLAESVRTEDIESSGAEIIRYVSSLELREHLLSAGGAPPDAILHAAAVADYAPEPLKEKVGSGQESWMLELKPLPKIAPELRKAYPRATLVMFKLESRINPQELQRRALKTARSAGADLIFANLLDEVKHGHEGWLLDVETGSSARVVGREEIARTLLDAVEIRRSGKNARSA